MNIPDTYHRDDAFHANCHPLRPPVCSACGHGRLNLHATVVEEGRAYSTKLWGVWKHKMECTFCHSIMDATCGNCFAAVERIEKRLKHNTRLEYIQLMKIYEFQFQGVDGA